MLKFILSLFIIWRVNLEVLAWVGEKVLPVREGFLGPIPWANFDGVHYLSIAKNGYFEFQQAFFPLYPLLIRALSKVMNGNYVLAGMVISSLSLLGTLVLLWRLIEKEKLAKWAIIFMLFSPTSFYFGSIYTESLFLLLILASFFSLKHKKWLLYMIFASLASATRLVGVFLFFPLGLFTYMVYLKKTVGDPLFFIRAQPAFGAGRSGGKIVFLPRVYFRYFKIFLTVPLTNYDYWIAILEFLTFNWVLFLLWRGYKKNLPRIWLVFSLLAVIGPTLTGSLSSIPRYVSVAFPIFIVLARTNRKLRYFLFVIFYLLFSILTILFTSGYFVA